MTEAAAILAVCLSIVALGCLAALFLVLTRLPKTDQQAVAWMINRVSESYLAGHTHGCAANPPALPPAGGASVPAAEAIDELPPPDVREIGIN
jgi:hypothetical protein